MQEIQNIVHTDEYDMDDGSQLSLLRQGFVCFGQKQYAAAIAFYKKALQKNGPLHLEILLYLADAYNAGYDFWLAAETINEACNLLDESQDKGTKDFQRSIRLRQGMYNRNIGNLWQAAEGYRRVVELHESHEHSKRASAYGSYLLTLAGLDVSLDFFKQELFYFADIVSEKSDILERKRQEKGKIRVGYISPDFRHHVMYGFYYYMLFCYNRELFHVTCYSLSGVQDEYTKSIRNVVESWRRVDSLSLDELAAVIRQDNIDILVDLAGHSTGSGLPVFALRPAPVQISGLGWMETTGFAATDYLLTDKYLDGEAEGYHSYLCEKPLFLSSQFCYRAAEGLPDVDRAPCLKNGYITFGSFNSYHKITDEMVAVWSRILQQVPESRLLLKCQVFLDESMQHEMAERFAEHGIESWRLLLEPTSSDYMQRYLEIDIALDTYPYTGGGTTLDALYMGVPVVSRYGNRRSSRFGLSILANAGLSWLAVSDVQMYIELAVALAGDRELLDDLHLGLRNVLGRSNVMNGRMYMRELEKQYVALLNYC
ncbi:O-linked N-acetylglucosamine transferase family protein [Anaerovibrio slackiae]|uniref:O-linked N-acetylglucosamine transferase, SPINDLY family protein n=1 Tax=Anaerovibrio slackiae TaxID=2652309 RepID=UPI003F178F0F